MRKTLQIVSFSILLSVFCFGQATTVAAQTPTVNAISPTALSFPIDFESGTYTFNDFSGGVATIIANPHSTGINTSAKVVQMIKNAGDPWGGSWFDFGAPIDFSTNKTFTMKVYSPRVGAKVTLKVENATNGGISFEKEALTTVANGWELVTFDYSAINVANSYQKIVVIFDNGTSGDGTANFTFLFDDINLITPSASSDATLKNLLVDGTAVAGFSPTIENYKYELPRPTAVVPTVTATTNDAEASVVITAAAGIPGTTNVIVTAKDGITKKTYTIVFSEILSLPINFEVGGYSLIGFDGGTGSVIANPHSSGINTSAKVAQIIRNGGATWAGSKLILSSKLDFSTKSTISMKVYSTRAGVPVLFKLEGDGGANTELSVNTTVANQWETLTWDFAGKPSNTYNALVFMFDFGQVGDGSANSTFLFDDIDLVKLTVGLAPLNAASNKVAVYPNPAENTLYINSKSDISKVAVYNIVGAQVKQINNVLQNIDVSDLQSGVYMIKLTDVNGKITTSKFMKK